MNCKSCGDPLYQVEFQRGLCGHCFHNRLPAVAAENSVCTANDNNEVRVLIPPDRALAYLIENAALVGHPVFWKRTWERGPEADI